MSIHSSIIGSDRWIDENSFFPPPSFYVSSTDKRAAAFFYLQRVPTRTSRVNLMTKHQARQALQLVRVKDSDLLDKCVQ